MHAWIKKSLSSHYSTSGEPTQIVQHSEIRYNFSTALRQIEFVGYSKFSYFKTFEEEMFNAYPMVIYVILHL